MFVEFPILEKVTKEIFNHLKQLGIEGIELDKDFYWNVPLDQKYEPYNKPTALDLGQLSDDLQELQAIQKGEVEPSGHALVALGSILRFIGERKPM